MDKQKIIKLDVPWKGQDELVMNFADINGNEIKGLASAFSDIYKGEIVPLLQLDLRFLELVAGRAAHVNPNDLGDMWGGDYMECLTAARNFLLKSEPEASLSKKP